MLITDNNYGILSESSFVLTASTNTPSHVGDHSINVSATLKYTEQRTINVEVIAVC